MENSIFSLKDLDSDAIAALLGDEDSHLKLIGEHFKCSLFIRDNEICCDENGDVAKISTVLERLLEIYENSSAVELQDVIAVLNDNFIKKFIINGTGQKKFYLRTKGQAALYDSFEKNVITLAVGPAGTGKTFLAVIYAYNLLKKGSIKKIIITRPVVESGESLGFLPGDLREKIDPYLRPIYDSFESLIGSENLSKLMERGVIEIAPLAYMRGRTLNDACIILDEAQNTVESQIKMFMTRLGFNSKMIITGDITQIDLPSYKNSGLIQAMKVVEGIDEIKIVRMNNSDVVRHPVVAKIIDAYERIEK